MSGRFSASGRCNKNAPYFVGMVFGGLLPYVTFLFSWDYAIIIADKSCFLFFDIFKDFYIILPQMQFSGITYNYQNAKPVSPDFEYHSGNNDRWLTVEEMKKLISEI